MAVKELNLPPLSDELVNKLTNILKERLFLHSGPAAGISKKYPGRNIVYFNYAYFKDLNSSVNDELIDIYSKYFDEPITIGAGRMKNMRPATPGQVQPHVDGKEKRWTAINLYLQLGGNSVRTCFYGGPPITDSNDYTLPYEDVTLTDWVVLEKNKWYAFDPQRCHGVDNVENERSFIMIMVNYPNSMPYDDFILKYNNLIKQDVK